MNTYQYPSVEIKKRKITTDCNSPRPKILTIPQEIPHLFLSPSFHHLPGVVPTVTVSESIITLYISISVPEIVLEKEREKTMGKLFCMILGTNISGQRN